MKPESIGARIPDLVLERYRLDELAPADRADVERLLREDARLRHRLDAIERSDDEMRESDFPAWLAGQVHSRTDSAVARPAPPDKRLILGWLPRWAVPAAIGAAAILLVGIALRTPGPASDSGGDRIKGLRPSLIVFRQTAGGSETLADGAVARSGDVLRVAYQAAGRAYGVILSIDGRGAVTLHLPPNGGHAVRLQPGDRVLLDYSYELDDAPEWERFYFITGQAPFDAAPVVAAARREAAMKRASPPATLAVPKGLEQSTFSLEKEHRQ